MSKQWGSQSRTGCFQIKQLQMEQFQKCHSQTGRPNPHPLFPNQCDSQTCIFASSTIRSQRSTHVMTVCSELSPDRTAHCGEPAARSARPPTLVQGAPARPRRWAEEAAGASACHPWAGAPARHPERTCSARSPAGANLGRLRSVARAAAHCGEPAAAGGYECASRDTCATSDTQEYVDRLEINCRWKQFLKQALTSLTNLQQQLLK